MSVEPLNDGNWHLDLRVPIALIGAILLQTGTFAWYASSMWTRLAEVERQIQTSAPQSGQIIRLEVKMDAIVNQLAEIKAALAVHH